MLQSLTNSKHKTISTCSLAALKNLYAARPSGMLDMVTKGASNGIPSLHARKRRNMVREMSDQLLETPNTPIEDQDDSDKSTTEDEDDFESSTAGPKEPIVNNFLEEPEELEDAPTDYTLNFQETEDVEVNEANPESNLTEIKSYYTEGTPLDTPRTGISNANSMSDLQVVTAKEPPASTGIETPDCPQLYATEGTPGCFSRSDSVENLENPEEDDDEDDESIEKGQKEVLEGPSEKTLLPDEATSDDEGPDDEEEDHEDLDECTKELPKKVSFMPEDQTPLIFSRASSCESLNSFVQQPLMSGYSSCDYSRAQSGHVSPSDLPDSPIQSRPYSPKQQGKQLQKQPHLPPQPAARPAYAGLAFAKTSTATQKAILTSADGCSGSRLEPKNSSEAIAATPASDLIQAEDDFGTDRVKTYDCEGTPAGHSGRASLSDITLSDEEVIVSTIILIFVQIFSS